MKLLWEDRAWSDYLYWQTQDKKTLKRINALIKDIQRSPYQGIGKPEPLRGNLSVCSWRGKAYTPGRGLLPCSPMGGMTLPWR